MKTLDAHENYVQLSNIITEKPMGILIQLNKLRNLDNLKCLIVPYPAGMPNHMPPGTVSVFTVGTSSYD
jgi:hypothetical protein